MFLPQLFGTTQIRKGALHQRDITLILLFVALLAWALVGWLRPCAAAVGCIAPVVGVVDTVGVWDAATPGWSHRAAAKLNGRRTGSWGRGNSTSAPDPVWFSPTQHAPPSVTTVRQCLKNKWIMMHGDSSLRFMFSSLIQLVGNADVASDRLMPKHFTCPPDVDCQQYIKGLNANRPEAGDAHEHYFRELWERQHSIRITFAFKQQLSTRHLSLESFITDSMQPDVLVLQAGAWNQYSGVSLNQSIADLTAFVQDVRLMYDGPILWVNLPACWPDFKEFAAEFNNRTRETLKFPILDRETSTQNLPEGLLHQCEGWHPYGKLSDLHRDWLLEALCEQVVQS